MLVNGWKKTKTNQIKSIHPNSDRPKPKYISKLFGLRFYQPKWFGLVQFFKLNQTENISVSLIRLTKYTNNIKI